MTRCAGPVISSLLLAACPAGQPRAGAGLPAERAAAWSSVSRSDGPKDDTPRPGLLSDAQLKSFFPDRLGDRLGHPALGAMTRMGDRALSEATRSYGGASGTAEEGQIELKIADARLEPRATRVIRSMAIGEKDLGADASAQRLVLPDAVGYARYDEADRVAQAEVLIADRIIASATVAHAEGPQEAAQALRALDTLRLAGLARGAE